MEPHQARHHRPDNPPWRTDPGPRRPGSAARIFTSGAVLTVAALGMIACNRQVQTPPVRRENLPPGGVRLTYETLPPVPLQPVEVARWDIWNPDGEYVFNTVGDIVGGTDSFFLLDVGNRQVVELSPRGEVLAVFAREGSGPGEFRHPLYLARWEDQLWVSDVGNRRFSIFDFQGNFLDDAPWPGASRLVNDFALTPDGNILHGGQWPLTVAELSEQDPLFYLAVFPGPGRWEEGAPVHLDTLATMAGELWSSFTIRSREGAQRWWGGAPVFSPEFLWAAGEDGIVTVAGGEYRFSVCDWQGEVSLEVVGPHEPIPVSEEWRRYYFDVIAARELERAEPFTLTSDSRARFRFAGNLPALTAIACDQQGGIWVEVTAADPGVRQIDLYSREGNYRGRMQGVGAPVAFTADGCVLFRIETGDDLPAWWVGRLPE